MRKSVQCESWVVYVNNNPGRAMDQARMICEQSEWDEMERARPGHHTLIQSGMANEGEAERLARGTSGDTKPRKLR